MTELERYIHTYFGVNKDDLTKISSFFKPERLKKRYYFLKTGRHSDQLGFVQTEIIREFVFIDDNEEILKRIQRNFDKIFVDELNDWYTDEEKWPQNRTFKMFSDWFEVEVCSMILDIEDFDIMKEEIIIP